MTARRSHRGLPDTLGPFHYQFRPGQAGRFGTVLIRAPAGAPLPACGDAITLTTRDCYDAEFEVTQVDQDGEGWRIGCERRPR